jgi:hypothetical protein
MAQGAERSQPAAPAILDRNVAAGLVGFDGFYFWNRVDVSNSMPDCSSSCCDLAALQPSSSD